MLELDNSSIFSSASPSPFPKGLIPCLTSFGDGKVRDWCEGVLSYALLERTLNRAFRPSKGRSPCLLGAGVCVSQKFDFYVILNILLFKKHQTPTCLVGGGVGAKDMFSYFPRRRANAVAILTNSSATEADLQSAHTSRQVGTIGMKEAVIRT